MPIKIRETEKEGHRKFRTQEPKRYRGLKSDLYGTKTHKKKPYHDKTTLHKSQRHPHSRLKTQKEYKAITDSDEYKKGGYKKKVEMLGGKTWTAQEMQKPKRPKSYSWNKTKILKAEGGSVRIAKRGGGRAYGKNS